MGGRELSLQASLAAELERGLVEMRAQVPVEAEVLQLDVFSAHADQTGLLDWVAACESAPQHVYVTHGEAVPADTLRREIQDTLGHPASVPEYLETVELG